MPEGRVDKAVLRPTVCPFCKGTRFDTLAKVITTSTFWRCRDCEGTWTIASQPPSPTRGR
jgi:ribosomal protein L37AE/L43A